MDPSKAYLPPSLTSIGKELRVYGFERILTHHPRRTLCLESPIDALDLGLCEARHAAQRTH